MNEHTERTVSQRFELLTKVGAAGIAFLYLCGFLVVSVHLSEFGVYSVELLRGQYLAAGVLSLTPLCLTYFVVALLHTSLSGFRFGPLPGSGWLRAKYVLVLTFGVLWEIFKVFAVSSPLVDGFASIFVPGVHDILWSHWRVISWLTIQSMFLVWCAIKMQWLASRSDNGETHGIKRTFPLAFLGAVSVFTFFAYMSYFANRLYSEIPFAIGGGKPQTVLFLMKQNHDGAPAPVVQGQSGERSIPYKLILETDTTYSVLSEVETENAIQFNHDAVNGYVILKDR
jgi:hypothetical protein